ncbi:MAG: sigma 54-interacting transcriptional regulator, partial [Deltaproteobacteria bacterium]|nr:sigma 54-interacting transcriptional regulator [Deltaproteobacteria bacterium]
ADGGDIFLDEINSLSLPLQAKILGVVEGRGFYRVGGIEPVRRRFRVMAGATVDLEDLISKGEFLAGLFYRLRVFSLKIPSLRERLEDIPLLVRHFIAKYCKQGDEKKFSDGALEQMMRYSWPGNVRELENLVQGLMILSPEKTIDTDDLPEWLRKAGETTLPEEIRNLETVPMTREQIIPLKKFIQQAERKYIDRVMRLNVGDKIDLAKALGISRSSLYDKIRYFH